MAEQKDLLKPGIKRVEVVIPAYNEEKRIGKTLDVLTALPEVDAILVVFEGNDKTPEIARQYQKVRVYVANRRLGKGGAIKKGIEEAEAVEKIAVMDADLPVSPDNFRQLIRIDDADLIIVRRTFTNITKIRLVLHKGFKFLTKLFFPSLMWIGDFQAGVKVMRADKAKEVLNELVMNDLLIDVNLIYAFKRRGYKIREVELPYVHDEVNSKISKKLVKVIILMFLSLIKLRIYYSPFKGILSWSLYKSVEQRIIKALT